MRVTISLVLKWGHVSQMWLKFLEHGRTVLQFALVISIVALEKNHSIIEFITNCSNRLRSAPYSGRKWWCDILSYHIWGYCNIQLYNRMFSAGLWWRHFDLFVQWELVWISPSVWLLVSMHHLFICFTSVKMLVYCILTLPMAHFPHKVLTLNHHCCFCFKVDRLLH